MPQSLKKSIVRGSAWSMAGQFLIMSITLLVNILLARMLTPTDFGKIGIIMFFVNIAYVLTEGGLSAALIRKTDATYRDYSTVFVFNLLIGCGGALIIAIFAGIISGFYGDPSLKWPLIISSLILIINSFQFVHNTRLVVEMRYRDKSLYEFVAVVGSSIVGVIAAVYGLHVWSIVAMQLSRGVFLNMMYFIFEKYRYSFLFSKNSFSELYGFGLNTSLSTLINITFDNIYQMILGAYFSLSQVGYFYQAKKIQDVPAALFSILSHGPVYAGLSKIQHDKDLLVSVYNKISALLMSTVGLITVCFFIFSDDIIVFLFGAKWLEAGFYLKFLAVSSFFFMQENVNRVIFKIYNKTRKLLHLELVKKVVQIISIFVGIYYRDIEVLLIGIIISNAFGYIINYVIANKILKHPEYRELSYILKVCAVILSIILVAEMTRTYFLMYSYGVGLLALSVIVLYVFTLKMLGLVDVKRQVKELLKVLR